MFRTIVLSFITAVAALAAENQNPEGTWATQINGHDHGVCYITFSNNFTEVGYGISFDADGPFELLGTWDNDNNGKLVGACTMGGVAASFGGKVTPKKLLVNATSTSGRFNFNGRPAGPYDDLSGPWTATVREYNRQFFMNFTCTLSTNQPGWFDLAGTGASGQGAFTVTGAIVITPDNDCAAYVDLDYGKSTHRDVLEGKLVKNGKKLVLRGHTDNKENASIKAERIQIE